MPTANLNRGVLKAIDGKHSIIIVNALGYIPGGVTLDVTGFEDEENILCGHVVIKNSKGNYAPMPLKDGAYDALPDGATYAGVLTNTIPVKDPRASILTVGQVNGAASPYVVTDEIKEKLHRIEFLYC